MRRATVAVSAALVLVAVLLSLIACDRESGVTEEPAAIQEPTMDRQPIATPEPTATLKPVATPELVIKEKVGTRAEIRSAERSTWTAPCGPEVVHIWGDRGGAVGWSTRLSGDEIVFTAGLEVYVVGVDGRGLRMISGAADERGPEGATVLDVSPDGREVVYAPCERMAGYGAGSRSPESNYYEHELAVARLDGGSVRQLTDNEHFEKYPSWSPDGQRIAFVTGGSASDRIAKKVAIYTMAAEGGDRRLEGTGATHLAPQWSPDGERIAYVGVDEDEGRAIYVVGSAGGTAQRLTDAASGPSWSPDGERIAYAKVDGNEVALYTIAADGTDARRLATITGWQGPGEQDPAKAWISKVSWSPDGIEDPGASRITNHRSGRERPRDIHGAKPLSRLY